MADLKVRRKNRISIVGNFRFTLPRERKRWMKKGENQWHKWVLLMRMGTLSVSFTTGLRGVAGHTNLREQKVAE